MRTRSPANSADSSPPVPARISRKALRASSGSRGSSAACSSASSALRSASAAAISSRAISAISGSASISRAGARSRSRCWKRRNSADHARRLRRARAPARGSAPCRSPRSGRRGRRRARPGAARGARIVGGGRVSSAADRRRAGAARDGARRARRRRASLALRVVAVGPRALLLRRNRRDTVCASCSRCAPSAACSSAMRAVQHLLRQAARQRFEHRVDVLAAWPAACARAPVSAARQSSAWRVQRLDQRHGGALVEPVHEALHAGVDDGLGLRHRGLALLAGRSAPRATRSSTV